MEIHSLNCPNCGAQLTINPGDTAIKCTYCGSDLRISSSGEASLFFSNQPSKMEKTEGEIERLIRAGQKINAIKLYREQTGVSLQVAKDFIDSLEEVMMRDPIGSSQTLSTEEYSDPLGIERAEVERLTRAGQKINAIKLVREKTGWGLKESKDYVDALEAGSPTPPIPSRPSKPVFTDSVGGGIDWERIRQELAHGRKIEAIKLYRQYTNVGLKEAKDAVEMFERGQTPPPPATPARPTPSIPGNVDIAQIRLLLAQGKKLEAIKLYREQTGVGLKEALDIIEAMPENRDIDEVIPSSNATPGTSTGTGWGCTRILLGMAFIVLLFMGGCGLVVQMGDEYACGMEIFTHNREVLQHLGEPVETTPLVLVMGYSSSSDWGGNSSVGYGMYTLVSGSVGNRWAYVEISHDEGYPYYMNANLFDKGNNVRVSGSLSESDCQP